MQKKVLYRNNHLTEENKVTYYAKTYPPRTIAEEDELIFKKYGGKKIDIDYFYKHINDFFGPRADTKEFKSFSPCKLIFRCTEIIVPDEYFYALYLISLDEKQKEYNGFYKELVYFVASRDGVNLYLADSISSLIVPDELYMSIANNLDYIEDGIVLYPRNIETPQEIDERADRAFKDLQERIFRYNNNLTEETIIDDCEPYPPRTIAEEEKRIFKLYGGKKLSLDYFYSHLTDFLMQRSVS